MKDECDYTKYFIIYLYIHINNVRDDLFQWEKKILR
jgi:hypothetical protein